MRYASSNARKRFPWHLLSKRSRRRWRRPTKRCTRRAETSATKGKTDAILTPSQPARGYPYRFNDRINVYLLEVRRTPKGPQVVGSRTHPTLIRRLFELEVPEIEDGTVIIKNVAREPGARTKT